MRTLQLALERTFLSDRDLFASPLKCSMSGGISYCYAFPEDEIFGASTDAYRYRWTSSCIANPEYEPEDMLKASLHALDSSEMQDTPFLVVLILPIWDDTPWNSAAIRGHHNMYVDPHPDPGGAHEICPRSQTIRRGQPNPLPREMASGIDPYRTRKRS